MECFRDEGSMMFAILMALDIIHRNDAPHSRPRAIKCIMDTMESERVNYGEPLSC